MVKERNVGTDLVSHVKYNRELYDKVGKFSRMLGVSKSRFIQECVREKIQQLEEIGIEQKYEEYINVVKQFKRKEVGRCG